MQVDLTSGLLSVLSHYDTISKESCLMIWNRVRPTITLSNQMKTDVIFRSRLEKSFPNILSVERWYWCRVFPFRIAHLLSRTRYDEDSLQHIIVPQGRFREDRVTNWSKLWIVCDVTVSWIWRELDGINQMINIEVSQIYDESRRRIYLSLLDRKAFRQ